jgi:hypothetical protein
MANPSVQAIVYNGVQLEYNHLTFTQRPVIDTDDRSIMYIETTYNIRGIITGDATTLPDELLQKRKDLSVPGATLWISEVEILNGATVSTNDVVDSSDDASDAREVNYGPIPGLFQVTQIPGGSLAIYQWSVIVNEPAGGANETIKNDHQGFTFTSSYVVDQDGFTTRTVQGKLVVTLAKVPAAQYRVALFKLFTLPGTEWRRLSQTAQVNEDGRTMSFSIQDREVQASLPTPVSGGEATYSTSIMPKTLMVEFSLAGTFSGGPEVAKSDIHKQIIALAAVKVPFWDKLLNNSPTGKRTFLQGVTLTESIYATNEISFRIWGTWPWERDLTKPLANMFVPPPSQGDAPKVPDADGATADSHVFYSDKRNDPNGDMAPVKLLANNTQTALTGVTGGTGGTGTPSLFGNLPAAGGGAGAAAAAVATTSKPGTDLSTDQVESPYIRYNEVISYEYDEGRCVLMPKDTATGPYTQQSRPRRLIIIQSGYAIRWGDEPNIPTPILPKNQRAMFRVNITRMVVQDISPWIKQHEAHWCYTYQYIDKAVPGKSLAKMPNDPRFAKPLTEALTFAGTDQPFA